MTSSLNNDSLRTLERESITRFVRDNMDHFRSHRVLDYACGKQPYRPIIEAAGGDYHGYDREVFPGNVSGEDIGPDDPLTQEWDVILNTQMIQYLPPWQTVSFFAEMRAALFVKRGVFLMTGPTTWPLVEPVDLCRYTPKGIETLLSSAGFSEVEVSIRASIEVGGIGLPIGWGAVAKP